MKTIGRWLDDNPGLRLSVWVQVALIVVALIGLPTDHRHILGLGPSRGESGLACWPWSPAALKADLW